MPENYWNMNLSDNIDKLILIIYNNKMTVSEDKLNDFYNNYFLPSN